MISISPRTRSKQSVVWNKLYQLELPYMSDLRQELVLVLELHRKGEGILGSARMFVPRDNDTGMRDYPLVQVVRSPALARTQSFI